MPRRRRRKGRHGQGTIYLRKDGRWVASLMREGKRVTRYAKTEEEAEALLDALLQNVEYLERQQGKPQTVKGFMEEWQKTLHAPPYSPRYLKQIEWACRRHIVPRLGDRELLSLSAPDVQGFVNALARADRADRPGCRLTPKTVSIAYGVLTAALTAAHSWGRIPKVPAGAKLPRASRSAIRPYTEEEAKRLLLAVADAPYAMAYHIALALGLRREEIVSLEWSDVDETRRTLTVRGTKTVSSHRVIRLSAEMLQAFRAHRRKWEAAKRDLGERFRAGDRLFWSATGSALRAPALYELMQRAARRAGLPQRRFHDLRHTCASIRLLRGEPVHQVARLLGHANPAITLRIYAHVLEKYEEEAADRMSDFLTAEFDSNPDSNAGLLPRTAMNTEEEETGHSSVKREESEQQ